MSDNFLALLENINPAEATADRIYAGDGTSVSRIAKRSANAPQYLKRLNEVKNLIQDVVEGRKHPYHIIEEAQSTSDFPLLFGDIIDRSLLGAYAQWPSVWASIARRGRRRDFRVGKAFTLDGANGVLPQVKQGAPYLNAALTDGEYSYAVSKYGRTLGLLWEALVNDDLDAFAMIPTALAQAARETENRFFTELLVDSSGPDATFFSTSNGNKAGTAAALSLDTLQAAISAMQAQKDSEGNPIFTGTVRLMVPPALDATATNIVSASQIITSPGATTGQQVVTGNWAASKVAEVVGNPWLPIVDTTSGNKAWYLFADPGIGRPALEMGFLTGHESPEVFMKAPNMIRVGGGAVGAEDGDFETDGIGYKVRHVLGGTLMDPKAAYVNVGV